MGDKATRIDEATEHELGELMLKEGLRAAGYDHGKQADFATEAWNAAKDELRRLKGADSAPTMLAAVEVAETVAHATVSLDRMLASVAAVRKQFNALLDEVEASGNATRAALASGAVDDLNLWPALKSLVRTVGVMRALSPDVRSSVQAMFTGFYAAAQAIKKAQLQGKMAEVVDRRHGTHTYRCKNCGRETELPLFGHSSPTCPCNSARFEPTKPCSCMEEPKVGGPIWADGHRQNCPLRLPTSG